MNLAPYELKARMDGWKPYEKGAVMGMGIGGHHSPRAASVDWLTPPEILRALGHLCGMVEWVATGEGVPH